MDTQTLFTPAFRKKQPAERLAILRKSILSSAYFIDRHIKDNHSNSENNVRSNEVFSQNDRLEQDLISIEKELLLPNASVTDLSDIMIESAVGGMFIPIGIVKNLKVNGIWVHVPIATEEASVISAASYAASILAKVGSIGKEKDSSLFSDLSSDMTHKSSSNLTENIKEGMNNSIDKDINHNTENDTTKGITAHSSPALQTAQISLEQVSTQGEAALTQQWGKIQNTLMYLLQNMHKRGGGLRDSQFRRLLSGLIVFHFTVDVQDVMGANVVNSVAEAIVPLIEEITGGRRLAAILSNYSTERLAIAEFLLEERHIPSMHIASKEAAKRIAHMSLWAKEDMFRAVTHNKGIMNGVSGLALATGNDTRAIEAASHALAASKATDPQHYMQYSPLSYFDYSNGQLYAKIEIPSLLATVGGATSHPVARWSLRVLEINSNKPIKSHRLNCIAAAIGLAQNFAALFALVSTGIQHGHLKYHHKKTAQASKS